ncbi:hypothetical protein FB192DRAFT_1446424 [Mucor lusitanicus]|uniref:Uncharacterized protein n=2 Tax=Mucor circinelloides f. lusitanicus TaxID=29924 RepID=A0A162RN76_MUCCL|nr:hypothetical protein FB192DRAFT_1446424 [Mucor lusitanicus]OAD07489.1 hypothetical protein MUCCIDRAFT_77549 [Mucor lusitanicus CBS 277.49]
MSPLDKIKETLFFKDYWLNKKPLDWDAIGYLTSLIEKYPATNKRTAHYNLNQDLEQLYTAFIDERSIKKHVHNIKQSLSSSSGRTVISQFWEKHADTLKGISLDNKTSQSVVLSAMMKTAASAASANASLSSAAACSSSGTPAVPSNTSKRKQEFDIQTRSRKRRLETIEALKEVDEVFVCDLEESVGTIIKKNAIEVHARLLSKEVLTVRERKIMTNGLSSILDLADNSLASQRSLFSESQWSELQLLFGDKLKMDPVLLSEKVKDVIVIVVGTLGLSGDYDCCISLVNKEIARSKSDSTIAALVVLKAILKIMKKYPSMLIKPPGKKVTESDYLRCVWSPILEALFPPEKNLIRIKSGESINSASTNNKNEQYVAASSIKSLKIDFRLLVDVGNDEVDVGAGECALNDADDKAIEDEGKLTRETKDALDEMVKSVPDDLLDTTCWGLQFTGSHCSLATIHLDSQGLYVNMHRHSFNVPLSHSLLESFGDTIGWLLLMREHMLRLRDIALRHKTAKHSNNISFNRRQTQAPNPRLSYMRDTYYTPPRYHESKLPVFIFSKATVPESVATSSRAPISPSSATSAIITGEPDKFGYIDQDNGTYYNIHTKKLHDSHPHMDANRNEEEDYH